MARHRLHQALIPALAFIVVGCARQADTTGPTMSADWEHTHRETDQKLERDPIGYLKEIRYRCEQLEQYTLTFYRQERLGVPPQLRPLEIITARFRAEPFSVKLEWADPEHDFYESVYVAGQNGDKLVVRERHGMKIGFIRLKPQVRAVRLQDPVTWKRSKNPMTDFGLARLMQRTLRRFEDPATADKMKIKYLGIANLELIDRQTHHFRIDLPPIPDLEINRQDLYIDVETRLPAGTDLWLPNGNLDARYRFADVRTDVQLTDKDFRLSVDHPDSQPVN